ncbi:hypothetical protein QCA50_004670 [Cerrena zonata]|uniref:Cytochrome c domain-containing protein n=1 Tax=Cerrena zonata TaxID=2478898 RepID=A0AAW0GHL4_9APHY
MSSSNKRPAPSTDRPEPENMSIAEATAAITKFTKTKKTLRKKLGGDAYLARLKERVGIPTGDNTTPVNPDTAASTTQNPEVIDSSISEVPTQEKTISPDEAKDIIAASIPALPLNKFEKAYVALITEQAKGKPNDFLLIERKKEVETTWAVLDTVVKKICIQEKLDPSLVWIVDTQDYAAGVEWLKEKLGVVFEPSTTISKTISPESRAEKKIYLKNDLGKKVHFDSQARLDARSDPKAWKAVLESGKDIALYTFANRTGEMKCLTCHIGGRGGNQSTKGADMRGRGPGYLTGCQCPEHTALTELFLTKIVAGDSDVPQRLIKHNSPTEFNNQSFSTGTFAMNPVNLARVEGMIYQISGLTVDTMFLPELQRTKVSAIWLLEKLEGLLIESEAEAKVVEEMVKKLKASI